MTPGAPTLRDSLPLVPPVGQSDLGTLSPQCTVAAAVAAGDVSLGGIGYASPGARVRLPRGRRRRTLLQLADAAA